MGSTGCYNCHAYPNEYHNDYMIILQDTRGRNYQLCESCISEKLENLSKIKNITKSFFDGNINQGNFYEELIKILEIKK